MTKNYILDTCVLLQDPNCIFKFEENNVIIPIGVIEELDKFKNKQDELGKNARQVSRHLDKIVDGGGNINEGAKIGDGTIKVVYNGNLKSYYKEVNVDLHVIHIGEFLNKEQPDIKTIIVSKDINVRIRAKALGLLAEDYKNDIIELSSTYDGFAELVAANGTNNKLKKNGCLSIDELQILEGESDFHLHPNFYVSIVDGNGGSLLGKVSFDCMKINLLQSMYTGFGNINPKNLEQTFLMDAIYDNSVSLVMASGVAGTGKSLVSIASAYKLLRENDSYKRMLVCRPIMPMGKDIGYLKGDLEEKMDPWMQPIYDAFEVITGKDGKFFVKSTENIKVEPLTYIRGRSIHDSIILIDEAQNLSRTEIKTIVTRVGNNTKIIFTGDIDQIDCPYLNKYTNGFSVLMKNFEKSKCAATVVMKHGVRSELAEEATKLM